MSKLLQFRTIDNALAEYYRQCGNSSYQDAQFLKYIVDEELNDDQLCIDDELGDDCDPDNCTYTNWTNPATFPCPHTVTFVNHNQKESYIFYVIQYCYKYGRPPSNQYIKSTIMPQVGGTASPMNIAPENKIKFVVKYQSRADLNVFVSKAFRDKLIQNILENFENEWCLHYYLDITTKLQVNDKQLHVFLFNEKTNQNKEIKLSIINYDLHVYGCKDTSIYGIIVPDGNKNDIEEDKWLLDDFLTADAMKKKYKIKPGQLPKSSRQTLKIKRQLKNVSMVKQALIDDKINLFDNEQALWQFVYHQQGLDKLIILPSMDVKINRDEWIEQCKLSVKNRKLPLIPILECSNNHHYIEYVQIVYIKSRNIYAGIGIRCQQNYRLADSFCITSFKHDKISHDIIDLIVNYASTLLVSSIHSDLDYIYYGHRLLGQHSQKTINLSYMARFRPFVTKLEFNN